MTSANIKFLITKRKSKKINEFSDREWALADIEHFGKSSKWNEENLYINAVENSDLVGLIHLKISVGVIEIKRLIVSHLRRDEGIGTKLIENVERIALNKNVHKIFLITGKGWKAEKFYQKNGFVQTTELKKHYLKKDWVLYSKFLP